MIGMGTLFNTVSLQASTEFAKIDFAKKHNDTLVNAHRVDRIENLFIFCSLHVLIKV